MNKRTFVSGRFMGLGVFALALGLASGAFAGQFNQPQQSWGHGSYNGGYHGNNGGNNGSYNGGHHGGGNNGNSSPIITDPKNPASTRDWSQPQAQSVYCIGAGCTLHYPTPAQQARYDGNQVCNNSGCHPR
jgi:hypothetical protein